MTSTPTLTDSALHLEAATGRPVVAAFRCAIAIALLVALGFQIVDKVTHNDMIPGEYFSFFTIQSSIIAAIVMAWGGVHAASRATDTLMYTAARMSVVSYAVVTAAVYNGLLRGIPSEGYVGLQWPGELMHVWVPIAILLDWVLSSGRARLGWTALRIVIAYPILWLVYTFVRGAVTGWYPYPFLEPDTGVLSISLYVCAIAAFIVGIASLAIALSRRTPRDRGTTSARTISP
ncbi:MAG: Pr6Pr family membrane protein [Microbacteriaceae bacterium]